MPRFESVTRKDGRGRAAVASLAMIAALAACGEGTSAADSSLLDGIAQSGVVVLEEGVDCPPGGADTSQGNNNSVTRDGLQVKINRWYMGDNAVCGPTYNPETGEFDGPNALASLDGLDDVHYGAEAE